MLSRDGKASAKHGAGARRGAARGQRLKSRPARVCRCSETRGQSRARTAWVDDDPTRPAAQTRLGLVRATPGGTVRRELDRPATAGRGGSKARGAGLHTIGLFA